MYAAQMDACPLLQQQQQPQQQQGHSSRGLGLIIIICGVCVAVYTQLLIPRSYANWRKASFTALAASLSRCCCSLAAAAANKKQPHLP